MLTTVEGKYSAGKVTLFETPEEMPECRVLVTFLTGSGSSAEHKQLVFGQFSGSILPTEEDFKIAEWRGDEETEVPDGG